VLLLSVPAAAQATTKAPTRSQVKKSRASVPVGFQEVFVVGVIPGDDGHTVVLTDDVRERFMPMGVGTTEALSIHIRLERLRFSRPLTHDLFDDVIGKLGGEVVRVQIDDLRDDVFLGAVYISVGGKLHRFDARPSDAIAIALGNEVPIFVARDVLEEASVRPDLDDLPEVEDKPEPKAREARPDAPPPGEPRTTWEL
jgi:bifunctional DNase/RNase